MIHSSKINLKNILFWKWKAVTDIVFSWSEYILNSIKWTSHKDIENVNSWCEQFKLNLENFLHFFIELKRLFWELDFKDFI